MKKWFLFSVWLHYWWYFCCNSSNIVCIFFVSLRTLWIFQYPFTPVASNQFHKKAAVLSLSVFLFDLKLLCAFCFHHINSASPHDVSQLNLTFLETGILTELTLYKCRHWWSSWWIVRQCPNCLCGMNTRQMELLPWTARPDSPTYLQDCTISFIQLNDVNKLKNKVLPPHVNSLSTFWHTTGYSTVSYSMK